MLRDELAALATGRNTDLFLQDVQDRRLEIEQRIGGKRVLVIGGAGSIGAATVNALCEFPLKTLHVVDQSENNLAELVRDLRSRSNGLSVPDFRTLPLDFGSPIMRRFVLEEDSYDYVLNFAAIKHVRSEKDAYSLLQMLDTNVLKPARLLGWLAEKGGTRGYFCVSTDKAANPVNLMGASKRLMEHVIFSGDLAAPSQLAMTSARFANVAFSDGSLLQSFSKRLEKRQPLAAPQKTRRFFISPQEAGWICLLGAVCAPPTHLLVPRLDPADDLRELDAIAKAFLEYHGFTPKICENEAEARSAMKDALPQGRYPLLLTALDTSGEKPYEEFVGSGEKSIEIGMEDMLAVPYRPAPAGAVAGFLDKAQRLVADIETNVSKEMIIEAVSEVVPELQHIERGKGLDARM